MSIILSKIKNGLYTGEDMWLSILMSAAIVLALAWCLSVAWQRNSFLRERLAGLTNHKGQIYRIFNILPAVLAITAMFKSYLAYMTLIDAVALFICYEICKLLIDKIFSMEWHLQPAKTSTVIYAIVALAIIVYIKLVGPFFSTPSLVVFALILSDAIGQVYCLVKGK